MLTTATAVVPIDKLLTQTTIVASDGTAHQVRLHARQPLIPPVPIHGLRLPRESEDFLNQFDYIANRPGPENAQERIDLLWAVVLEALLLSGASVATVPGTAGLLLVTETRFGTMVRGAVMRKQGGKRRLEAEVEGDSCALQTEPLCPLVDLQTLGIADPPERPTPEPPEAKMVLDSIKINEEGRIEFPIPWVGDGKPSPNLGQARSRLWSTLRRFTPEQRKEYVALFRTYETSGMIECVGELDEVGPFLPGRDHLLPHFGVEKASSTRTRIRPVFDSACRTPNGSLNDFLPAWAPLSLHLLPALQAVRAYPVATVCDIRQAFLQLAIGDQDARFFQFLLPRDTEGPESDHNLLVYRWRRVVFGAAVAPFLLSVAIRYIASRLRARTIPGLETFELAEALAAQLENNTYADNITIGAQDVGTAKALVDALVAATETFGWVILDFAASHPGVVDHLPAERRLTDDTVPLLGLRWTRSTDLLYIKPPTLTDEERSSCPTFRRLSALAAKYWDPLGALGPTPLPVKQALSRCWTKCCAWDRPLPFLGSLYICNFPFAPFCAQCIAVVQNVLLLYRIVSFSFFSAFVLLSTSSGLTPFVHFVIMGLEISAFAQRRIVSARQHFCHYSCRLARLRAAVTVMMRVIPPRTSLFAFCIIPEPSIAELLCHVSFVQLNTQAFFYFHCNEFYFFFFFFVGRSLLLMFRLRTMTEAGDGGAKTQNNAQCGSELKADGNREKARRFAFVHVALLLFTSLCFCSRRFALPPLLLNYFHYIEFCFVFLTFAHVALPFCQRLLYHMAEPTIDEMSIRVSAALPSFGLLELC